MKTKPTWGTVAITVVVTILITLLATWGWHPTDRYSGLNSISEQEPPSAEEMEMDSECRGCEDWIAGWIVKIHNKDTVEVEDSKTGNLLTAKYPNYLEHEEQTHIIAGNYAELMSTDGMKTWQFMGALDAEKFYQMVAPDLHVEKVDRIMGVVHIIIPEDIEPTDSGMAALARNLLSICKQRRQQTIVVIDEWEIHDAPPLKMIDYQMAEKLSNATGGPEPYSDNERKKDEARLKEELQRREKVKGAFINKMKVVHVDEDRMMITLVDNQGEEREYLHDEKSNVKFWELVEGDIAVVYIGDGYENLYIEGIIKEK